MTQLKVDAVVNLAGSGKPNFPVSPTHSSGSALSTLNTYSYTSSGTEPSSPKNGAIWWDSSNNKVMVYINSEFKEISLNTDYPLGTPAWSGDRGLVAGVDAGASNKHIIYFNIAGSGGGSANFGDLTLQRAQFGSAGSTTRGCFLGGYSAAHSDPAARRNEIDYVTIATAGDATDFGDLTVGRSVCASCSNGTRILTASGMTPTNSNIVDYVTVANTGNATDFGDLTLAADNVHGGAAADATRALFSPISTSEPYNGIDYFTIASTGNGTDFGDLLETCLRNTACSDATRAVFIGGGYNHSPANKNMEYVTIQTTGNGTNFGDLTEQSSNKAATSNATIGVHISGVHMEKFTIQTAANATDFGDIIESRNQCAGTSGAPS